VLNTYFNAKVSKKNDVTFFFQEKNSATTNFILFTIGFKSQKHKNIKTPPCFFVFSTICSIFVA